MAEAQYNCPKCRKGTGKRCVYSPGKYEHKCTNCGSINIIQVSGYNAFCPRVLNSFQKGK